MRQKRKCHVPGGAYSPIRGPDPDRLDLSLRSTNCSIRLMLAASFVEVELSFNLLTLETVSAQLVFYFRFTRLRVPLSKLYREISRREKRWSWRYYQRYAYPFVRFSHEHAKKNCIKVNIRMGTGTFLMVAENSRESAFGWEQRDICGRLGLPTRSCFY